MNVAQFCCHFVWRSCETIVCLCVTVSNETISSGKIVQSSTKKMQLNRHFETNETTKPKKLHSLLNGNFRSNKWQAINAPEPIFNLMRAKRKHSRRSEVDRIDFRFVCDVTTLSTLEFVYLFNRKNAKNTKKKQFSTTLFCRPFDFFRQINSFKKFFIKFRRTKIFNGRQTEKEFVLKIDIFGDGFCNMIWIPLLLVEQTTRIVTVAWIDSNDMKFHIQQSGWHTSMYIAHIRTHTCTQSHNTQSMVSLSTRMQTTMNVFRMNWLVVRRSFYFQFELKLRCNCNRLCGWWCIENWFSLVIQQTVNSSNHSE